MARNNFRRYLLDTYDIKNDKTTYIDASLYTTIPDGNSFVNFIYPSQVLFSKNDVNGQGGTFAINFSSSNPNKTNILPNQIKLVGLIPSNVIINNNPLPTKTINAYPLSVVLDNGSPNPLEWRNNNIGRTAILDSFIVSIAGPEGINVNSITIKTSGDIGTANLSVTGMYLMQSVAPTGQAGGFYKGDQTFTTVAPDSGYNFTFKKSPFYIPANGSINFTIFATDNSALPGSYKAPVSITGIQGSSDKTNTPASFSGNATAQDIQVISQ